MCQKINPQGQISAFLTPKGMKISKNEKIVDFCIKTILVQVYWYTNACVLLGYTTVVSIAQNI